MEKKSIMFYNWSDTDFNWKYDGEMYKFKTKESMYLPDYLAKHFAKHLVDRELTNQGKQVIDGARAGMIKKCYTEETISRNEEQQKIDLANKPKRVKKESKKKANNGRKQLKK